MSKPLPSSISLREFQSFDAEGATIFDPRHFNIFVGPNNVGKSKLLRAFQRLATLPKGQQHLINESGDRYLISYEYPITPDAAKAMFPEDTYGGTYGSPSWWENVGKHLTSSSVELTFGTGRNLEVTSVFLDPDKPLRPQWLDPIRQKIKSQPNHFPLPFAAIQNFFLAAERDVQREAAVNGEDIQPTGEGVTNAIRRYLHVTTKDSSVVREGILKDLNRILRPDFSFKEILARQHENNGDWEIYLTTDRNQTARLSQSGSGLKTVLALLANIHIRIAAGQNPVREGVYILEELENSLHPRAQRNLYEYIRERFIDDAVVLLSTHSPVAMDFFQGDADVAFYGVSQVDGKTKCRKIDAFEDKLGTLDAIGVHASEALVSNFVVWVEGPSDRIYLNNWIRLVTDGRLREGVEYVIMFYGGKLLSHLALSEDDLSEHWISLLQINPKCAVVIDSDKSESDSPINGTKKRIAEEAEKTGRLCWITAGREIENYIASEFLEREATSAPVADEYADVFESFDFTDASTGRPIRSKVELATLVVARAKPTDFLLDWNDKVTRLVAEIDKANS